MPATASLQTPPSAAAAEPPSCPYCANVKLLREILPPKRCDYCRQWRCQFCTLKFPLLGVRRVLPKVLKGNSRICLQCFNHHWRQNGLSAAAPRPVKHSPSLPELADLRHSRRAGGSFLRDSLIDAGRRESLLVDDLWAGSDALGSRSARRLSFLDEALAAADSSAASAAARPAPGKAVSDAKGAGEADGATGASGGASGAPRRLASLLGLAPMGSDPAGLALVSAVELWLSLFAAAILLVMALTDALSLQQRVCYCVATYGLFLTLHPWVHAHRHPPPASSEGAEPATPLAPPEKASASSEPVGQESSAVAAPRTSSPGPGSIPPAYLAKKREIEDTVAYYLSPKCPWKQVRRSDTCTIYELTGNKTPFPIFKLETFITGISMADFMAHIRSTRLQDRSIWDVNAANFEVIETFDCADAGLSVCVNTQKPFFGGLVASRDFCMLYLNKPDAIVFTSVEHPKVPPRPGSTRAHLYISLYACKEGADASGTPGFTLTNVGQVDIRGSLPTRMLYKGTMDNMENVLAVFRDAGKLFPKASRA